MAIKNLAKRANKTATKPATEEAAADGDDEIAKLKAQLAAKEAQLAGKEPADEPPAVEAEVVKEEEEPEPAPEKPAAKASGPKSLAKLGSIGELIKASSAGAMGALTAFIDEDEKSVFEHLFPGVGIKGGENGGSWEYPDNTAEDVADTLPVGRKPFGAFVLAYRLRVVAWKQDYEDRSKNDGPAWSCAIPQSENRLFAMAARACKNYQFTKKADKDAFDWNNGDGCGRPVPTVEFLAWTPDAGLITVSCQTNYGACARTIKHIKTSLFDEEGNFVPQPLKVAVDVQEESTANNTWKTFAVDFQSAGTGQAKLVEGFKEFVASLDDDTQALYEQWVGCADNPIDDKIVEHLETAESI